MLMQKTWALKTRKKLLLPKPNMNGKHIKKRKRNFHTNHNTQQANQTTISNRYDVLSQGITSNDNPVQDSSSQQPKTPKPPPIYIHGVNNYNQMIDNIATVLKEKEQCYTTALVNDTIKVNTLRKGMQSSHPQPPPTPFQLNWSKTS